MFDAGSKVVTCLVCDQNVRITLKSYFQRTHLLNLFTFNLMDFTSGVGPLCLCVFCFLSGVLRLNREPNQGGENETDISSLAPVAVPTGASEAANFLRSFERRYGYYHPEFQAVSFMEAVRRAGQEFKFLFVYLHSAGHMNTPLFCEQTLCNEAVVAFINENFIAWGGDVHSAEGYQMGNSLKASTFPFCAVIMSSSSVRFGILQQVPFFSIIFGNYFHYKGSCTNLLHPPPCCCP